MRNIPSSSVLRHAVTTHGYVVGNLDSAMAKKPTRRPPAPRWRKNFIKEWRQDRGLTQQQLADLSGYTKATISRIESGDIAYTRENLEAIAQALGTHPGLLLIRPPTKADALPHRDQA